MSSLTFINAMLNNHEMFEQICMYMVIYGGIEKLNNFKLEANTSNPIIDMVEEDRRMMEDYWRLVNTKQENLRYDTPVHMASVNQEFFLSLV